MENNTIGSVCKRFSSGKGIAASDISESGLYPVIGANGLRGYTDTYNFDGRCAVIGRQGAYCGNVRYFEGKAYMTEHAIVAEANIENDSGYLAYKLKEMNLSQFQGQSAQPGLSVNTLSKVGIEMPDLQTQKRVFDILHKLDKKISNNNAISSQLSSLAETIYDYWFLQFDFPDENGKPYKSSGGKMVWNEELKREIPEGWKIIKLSDIADLKTESLNPANYPTQYFWHYSIPAFDEAHYPSHEPGATINSSKYVVPTGSILVSKLNPQFKRVWNPQKYGSDCICSTEFLPFVPRAAEYKGYLYILLNSDAFQQFMMQSSSSSTGSRKRMQPELCGNFTLAFPADDSLVKMFSGKIAHILNMLTTISEENRYLSSLRDFLLPMLMNGQVTFKDKK